MKPGRRSRSASFAGLPALAAQDMGATPADAIGIGTIDARSSMILKESAQSGVPARGLLPGVCPVARAGHEASPGPRRGFSGSECLWQDQCVIGVKIAAIHETGQGLTDGAFQKGGHSGGLKAVVVPGNRLRRWRGNALMHAPVQDIAGCGTGIAGCPPRARDGPYGRVRGRGMPAGKRQPSANPADNGRSESWRSL